MITRRLALLRIFSTTATAATTATTATTATALTITPAEAKQESRGHFKHPAEYVAAMHVIGWRPLAMYQRLEDGTIHRMGVEENGGGRLNIENTWREFHAIQMRMPVQLPWDVHPDQDWWNWVWWYLYDKGEREDVTPKQIAD